MAKKEKVWESEKDIKNDAGMTLESNLWQVQKFLGGEISAQDIQAGSSTNRSGRSLGGGLEVNEGNGESMDVEGLAAQLGGLPYPPGAHMMSGMVHTAAAPASAKEQYVKSKSGNWLIKRNPATTQYMPGYNTPQPQMEMPLAYQQQYLGINPYDANEIIKEFQSFQFSPENREYEIGEIKKAIAQTLDQLKIQRIADSSKKIAKYAEKFFKTKEGGIRGVYTILGQKISMLVQGDFNGDETLYLTVEGDEPVGIVIKKDPYTGKFVNSSDKFQIDIQKI